MAFHIETPGPKKGYRLSIRNEHTYLFYMSFIGFVPYWHGAWNTPVRGQAH
jgi:hypothetical protein